MANVWSSYRFSHKATQYDPRQCKLRGHLGKTLWEHLMLLSPPTTATCSIVQRQKDGGTPWLRSLDPRDSWFIELEYSTPAFLELQAFSRSLRNWRGTCWETMFWWQGRGHISLQPLHQLTSRCTKSWRSVDLHNSFVRLSYIPSPCRKIHFPYWVQLWRVKRVLHDSRGPECKLMPLALTHGTAGAWRGQTVLFRLDSLCV